MSQSLYTQFCFVLLMRLYFVIDNYEIEYLTFQYDEMYRIACTGNEIAQARYETTTESFT